MGSTAVCGRAAVCGLKPVPVDEAFAEKRHESVGLRDLRRQADVRQFAKPSSGASTVSIWALA